MLWHWLADWHEVGGAVRQAVSEKTHHWTMDELREIEHLRDMKTSGLEIAQVFGVSPSAIRAIRWRRKTSDRYLNRKEEALWTQEDHDLLVFLRTELSMPCWAIGALLGRSAAATHSRCAKFGLTHGKGGSTSWLSESKGTARIKVSRYGTELHHKMPTATLAYIRKKDLWHEVGRLARAA